MQESLPYFPITATVAAAPQIEAADMPRIAALGYAVVINNRPDGEAPGQPSSERLREAAEAAGLEYHYCPVNAFNYPGDGVELMAKAFADSARPVFAFCRSGTRSANLWISSQPESERDAARIHVSQLGIDVSMSLR
jgi:sulfide:quinone oxidoreductase